MLQPIERNDETGKNHHIDYSIDKPVVAKKIDVTPFLDKLEPQKPSQVLNSSVKEMREVLVNASEIKDATQDQLIHKIQEKFRNGFHDQLRRLNSDE